MNSKRRQTKIINLEFDNNNKSFGVFINIPYDVDHIILKNIFIEQNGDQLAIDPINPLLLLSNLFKEPVFFLGNERIQTYSAANAPTTYNRTIRKTYVNMDLYCELTTNNINSTYYFLITDKNKNNFDVATLDLNITLQFEFVEK